MELFSQFVQLLNHPTSDFVRRNAIFYLSKYFKPELFPIVLNYLHVTNESKNPIFLKSSLLFLKAIYPKANNQFLQYFDEFFQLITTCLQNSDIFLRESALIFGFTLMEHFEDERPCQFAAMSFSLLQELSTQPPEQFCHENSLCKFLQQLLN